jgi:uncharacterized protein with PIN domain
MRFVADHMLGSLARWLRFLGFDTAYPDVLSDRELAEIAARENRILLTRDKELAKTVGDSVLYIKSTETDEQLNQVIMEYDLTISNELTRCSLCNTVLESVDKEDVKGKVPEKVFEIQNEFWECGQCNKYYWPGTHYKNIKEKLEKLKGKTR